MKKFFVNFEDSAAARAKEPPLEFEIRLFHSF